MTDTEMKRRKAICEVAGVTEIDDLSDGFHTFRQLYYQRMILFATIVKQNRDRAWKSLRHEDGELCFGGGWFIVGVDTPEGSYTYHYEDNYFSLFDCEELERGKHWDGHTEKDVTRLLSLPSAQPEPRWIPCSERLPEEYGNYLISIKGEEPDIGTINPNDPRGWSLCDANGFYWANDKMLNIIAWMPLPKPARLEGE